MLRSSLFLVAVALACLFFADVAIHHGDPWRELGAIAHGALLPDFTIVLNQSKDLLNTLVFAMIGTALGVAGGALLAWGFGWRPVRAFCAFIRAIHEIFWAFLFLPLVGLNPVCGVLAIAIPYAGIFAKVFAEILAESDQRPLHTFPHGSSSLARFCYGTFPIVYPRVKHYISYRFECGLRSSAVLGFIGLPTLGYHLETTFREGLYAQSAALLYVFYALIASLKWWIKPRLIGIYLLTAFVLLPKGISFSLANARRFLTHDILPWPMRRQGFLDGSGNVAFPVSEMLDWLHMMWQEQIYPGLVSTVVLTQIALALTGILTLVAVYFSSRHFQGKWIRQATRLGLIVVRTTPEYILAYLLVMLFGPSMLPAILAISIHNGAILGHLSGNHADLIPALPDWPRRKLDRFFYEVLPRIYGQFLAFLFYRWEVMMRESAILGILGITTLGFYIDSAMAEDRIDRAWLLILCTALLNMAIDASSRRIRGMFQVRFQQDADAVTY